MGKPLDARPPLAAVSKSHPTGVLSGDRPQTSDAVSCHGDCMVKTLTSNPRHRRADLGPGPYP